MVSALPGVQSASVNFGTARLTVTRENGAAQGLAEAVARTVGEAGYTAIPAEERGARANRPFWRRERRVLTTSAGLLLALAAFAGSLLHASPVVVNALYGAAAVVSGYGFARAGLLAARAGRADMNLLMTVAAIGAAALGDWAEAATVVILFAFGGTLQAYTLEKTRGAIRALMDLSPATALVRRPDRSNGLPVMRELRLPVEQVQPGDTVLVGPGERLPLDGVILEGETSIDQSPITGESVPVDARPGSEVFAGTINGGGAFAMRSLRASTDTTLAHIIHMVEEAQSRRAPSQAFVDRFSAIYTPVVIGLAVLVAAVPPLFFAATFGDWFYRALVLLVIACPCALVISTPVSIVAAIGAATRQGVLVKGGATLEALGNVRSIAFDKTGTLTEGRPQVVAVHALDGDDRRLLALAAAVEQRSEHPLARAIVHAARNGGASGNGNRNGSGNGNGSRNGNGAALPEAGAFTALTGLGARAGIGGETYFVGNAGLFEQMGVSVSTDGIAPRLDALAQQGITAVVVGTGASALGVIGLADRPRPEAQSALRSLKAAGVECLAMLTGDNERTAEAIARQVGVDECYAGLLPGDKAEVVRRMASERGPVAMVGEGVNDAPALAAADVGIAMGVAGTDAALEVADVALMSDDLSKLSYAVLLSRRTLQVIKQNIGVSLGVKALALGLAAFGVLPLWGAIFADMGVSLLVTLNGMRLLRYGG
jgi:Cd2+/Zn2+-exporting ATPase